MSRQKVEYAPNLPTIIELDGPGIAQANGRGEDEYRYFLQNDRITWVPPTVHAAIIASGADYPGAAFQVTKHQAKARAPIQWEVRRVDTPAGYGYSAQPTPQPPPAAPPLASAPRGPQPAAPLAADAPEFATGAADRMAAALRDSIELWRGVSQMEPGLKWDAGDVRCLAATLFIGGGK